MGFWHFLVDRPPSSKTTIKHETKNMDLGAEWGKKSHGARKISKTHYFSHMFGKMLEQSCVFDMFLAPHAGKPDWAARNMSKTRDFS